MIFSYHVRIHGVTWIYNFVSVLEVGDGVFEVLSTSGDTHLGGDDFDKVGALLLFCIINVDNRLVYVGMTTFFANCFLSLSVCYRELLIGWLETLREMKV